MYLRLIQPPAGELLSLDEAKAHMRVDVADDDTVITQLIAAAIANVDGDRGWVNRALLSQTWELVLDAFPTGCQAKQRRISLPLPPLQLVDSISYVDGNGAAQTLDPTLYSVKRVGSDQPAHIAEAFGATWPTTRAEDDAVTVRFVAGYGDTAADVPADLRLALRMTVAHWYEHRESVSERQMHEVPVSAKRLFGQHRVWTFS